jgi:thiol-disulfide isomerase/thioredoxin
MRLSKIMLLACLVLVAWGANGQEFEFKDLRGQAQRLSDYRGRWVLVNFWATWCPPCLEEMPDLMALHNAHKDKDLVVIGVALDSTRAAVEKFAREHKINYPLVVGDYNMAAQVGEVEALPTSYLFDPQGNPASYREGMVSRDDIEAYISSKPIKK